MASYRIIIRKSVSKYMKRIPEKDVQRILNAVKALMEDPRPPQSKRLSGEEKYRLRCGVYRVLYEIQDEELVVCVVRVRHRKNVYR